MPLTRDSYGVKRGQCMSCDKCPCYNLNEDADTDDCENCGHPSLKHVFLSRPAMPKDHSYDEEEQEEGDDAEFESSVKRKTSRILLFGHQDQEYFQFSNLHKTPIDLDGRVWDSVSHYYESQKYLPDRKDLADKIQDMETPLECQQYSLGLTKYVRKDWRTVREQVMLSALRAKFGQHAALRRSLIDTKTKHLIYDDDDLYWGNGGSGNLGENYLGRMLMRVRGEIRGGIVRNVVHDDRRRVCTGDGKCVVS